VHVVVTGREADLAELCQFRKLLNRLVSPLTPLQELQLWQFKDDVLSFVRKYAGHVQRDGVLLHSCFAGNSRNYVMSASEGTLSAKSLADLTPSQMPTCTSGTRIWEVCSKSSKATMRRSPMSLGIPFSRICSRRAVMITRCKSPVVHLYVR
jgi:hypothetical protein